MTTAQLRAVGWSSSVVAKRVAEGRLHPVFAQVYSLGGPPRRDREWWMAAVLSCGPHALLCDAAGAELYGLLRYPLGAISVRTRTRRRPRDGIRTRHGTVGVAWRYVDHIPVTGPEQTILDCATTVHNDRAYRRIVRQAQVDGITSHVRLLAFAARNRGVRGVARLRKELADGPSPTRSGFEDEILEVLRHGGEPAINVHVHGEEVDLYWPALGIVVEVDGGVHHNPTAKADDARKQARLEARGLRVLRLS